MKKIAIYGQSYNLSAAKEVAILLATLEEQAIEIVFEKKFYLLLFQNNSLQKEYPTFSSHSDLDSSFDVLFTIGGDGTILRAVTYIRDSNIPIMGINTGRLGFLATTQKDQIAAAVTLLLNKEYTLQERSLVSIKTAPPAPEFSGLNFALNEVTIARKNTTSMIGIETHLDGEYLTNYWADGLIVSTPTGSTGYSLSCDGPVVLPNSKNLIITPIAPHNLNARPLVITDDTKIQLAVTGREKDFLISLDSRIATMPHHTKIYIEKAPFTISTVLPLNQSFLKTIRSKLLWGEDTRNETNQ